MAQGVGALTAALFISTFSNFRRKGLLLTVGQVVFALGLIVISFISSLAGTLPLIALMGWALVSQMAIMNTLIQLDVPDSLRGRVYSVYLWAIQGVAPFGSLFIGWLAQSQGVPRAALVAGVICLLAVFILHARFPDVLRKIV
jgi:predicted MFS family arabinose efflux permease